MPKSRLFSLIVACLYLPIALIAYRWGKLGGTSPIAVVVLAILLGWVILALACIWFGDEIGAYKGKCTHLRTIDSASPGCVVRLMGWLLLFVAFLFLIVVMFGQ